MSEVTKEIPVDYDDSNHRYFINNEKYTSASQLVEKFRQPFDTVAVAIKYAEKNGQTPEFWIAQWKEKNDKSKVRGNLIHDSNDLALQARMIDVVEGNVVPVQNNHIYNDDIPWFLRPDGVYTERKLWHHGYRIAGRADKIILLSSAATRYASIDDYKTNEKLEMNSYVFKNGMSKKMQPPLAHVEDCNWFHYCLQLSLYMLMLEYQGFTPGKMRIIYYPHPTEEIPNPPKQFRIVPYMKKEVILMCKYLNS